MNIAIEKRAQLLSKLGWVIAWALLVKALLWVVAPFVFFYFV